MKRIGFGFQHLLLIFSLYPAISFGLSDPTSLAPLTERELQSAFPGRPIHKVKPQVFQQFVNQHAAQGRLYTSPLPFICESRPPLEQEACRDSILMQASLPASDTAAATTQTSQAPRALQELQAKNRIKDSLSKARGEGPWQSHSLDTLVVPSHANSPDPDASENAERTKGYASNFFLDVMNWGGDGKLDGGDWAVVLYVVVGAVVVSAFVIYAPYLVYQLMVNANDDPVFQEIGMRYSFSGKTWADGGPPLYRNAHLLGLHYAIGLDKRGFGIGLAAEGGYIDLSLQDLQNPAHAFDFKGGYFVGGPMVRFGNNQPASLTLEFLNGTSDHGSIGWISKSRMTLQGRVGSSGLLLGAHIGAVFYDLQFYDGLVQRRGDFNRDLSFILGVDTGWEF